jgi:FixJ family two-component response regulator
MAHMRGTELAAMLGRLYPGIKTVYMSGYQDYGADERNFEKGCFFVQKPFSRDNLLDVIARALKANRAAERTEDRLDERVEEEPLPTIQAVVTVPMKARRKASRRSRRPAAV